MIPHLSMALIALDKLIVAVTVYNPLAMLHRPHIGGWNSIKRLS